MTRELKLPNFLILGATKSGTTSLHHYLKQHPDVFLPEEKEIQFFIDDQLYEKGMEFYQKQYFSGTSDYGAVGEATPLYFHRPELVIPRLKESFPADSLKFVLLLRDPVKRAWSHYLHMVRLGAETLDFERALLMEEKRLHADPASWYSYFSDGLYGKLLEQWFDAFSAESFLILTQDDFVRDVHLSLKKIFSFLGVDDSVCIQDLSIKNEAGQARSKKLMSLLMGRFPGANLIKAVVPVPFRRRLGMKLRHLNIVPSDQTSPMDADMETELRKRYVADICKLEGLLNFPLEEWKKPRNSRQM